MTLSRRALVPTALLAGSLILAGCGHQNAPPKHPNQASNSASRNLDPLTGLDTPQHGPLVAVMVENSEYARPQYGLRSADVVYEAYTENFYYSRYMLLFWGHAPKIVAPVRSARPYFVSWVHEWHAAYVHAGASTLGYQSIAQDHIHNLDLDANAQSLGWTSPTRPAPHNRFSNVAKDMKAAKRRWGNPPITPHWSFVSHSRRATPRYQSITLQWNSRNTIEEWRWNARSHGWTRWVQCPVCANPGWTQVVGQNSKKPVMAANVVIQYTHEWLDMQDPNTVDRWILMNTHGQGKALLFLGHRYYQGTWQSTGPGQPTKFYLANGQPAKFARGQTWIEVVPGSGSTPNGFHLGLSAAP